MSAQPPNGARVGALDLLRLGVRLGLGKLGTGGDFDGGAAGCRWAREIMAKGGADGLDVRVAGRRVELVGDRARSDAILADPPLDVGYTTGDLKREAMEFLAPGAVTVADGERWRRLRAFNDEVLESVGRPDYEKAFAAHVGEAFDAPIRDAEAVRTAMGRAMVAIVLGGAPVVDDPAGDIRALFDVVQSPLKRKVFGFVYTGRRDRFKTSLKRRWADVSGDEPTLLGRARAVAPRYPEIGPDEILDQVPHWMFTFTGSGADLLFRTLALITSRPDAHGRVVRELGDAGDTASSFTRACLLEAGRLFPPVTKTFHRPPAGAGDREIAHWFPLLQRDPALGPSVDAFQPDRWLAGDPDAAARASNLFLRGPRGCPGEKLILFVCLAAIQRQLGELGFAVRPSPLSTDPLPVSFPGGDIQFTTERVS